MNQYDVMDLLGKAFAFGEIDNFKPCMLKECTYHSDYAKRHLNSAEDIEKSMKNVFAAVQKKGTKCRYSYQIISLENVLNKGITFKDLREKSLWSIGEYGLLLFQYGGNDPVAVVFAHFTPNNSVSEIVLSRNSKWFRVNFYGEDDLTDSEKDIPYTVKPLTGHHRQVKELQSHFTHQRHEEAEWQDENIYIWRKADEYFKDFLKDNGYFVYESYVYADCIGYRCERKGLAYTVYMFAYGKKKTTPIDGDYCSKFHSFEFSKDSTILVVYLHVKRSKENDEYHYKVCGYSGGEDLPPEFWRLSKVNGKNILEYLPYQEMEDLKYKLMYAFNHDDLDVYESIIRKHNPSFIGPGDSGYAMNSAVFSHLHNLHKQYGKMKLGYVRYNDVIYTAVPCLDGYGYFGFRVDKPSYKIGEITGYAFNDKKVIEFIRTEETAPDDLYDDVPKPANVIALAPAHTERFALKIVYDNGECKKYVLPVEKEKENDEVVSLNSHVFTDKIWQSAEISSCFPKRRPGIRFKNGYFLSSLLCYEEGTDFTEPEKCVKTVYEDSDLKIRSLWKWNCESIYQDEETGILKVLLSGLAFNGHGKSTFGSVDGERLCTLDFDYIEDFNEGMAVVGIVGKGYGYLDKNMNIPIPIELDHADKFHGGKGRVSVNDTWYYVDKSGKRTKIGSQTAETKYEDFGEYSEGLCKVSTMKLDFLDLAYHSDYSEIAGVWGFINEEGQEVIPPQYIYANDFENGMAIVCKGKWTRDEKWNNEHRQDCLWTEEELWGAIDKNGHVVIPFLFDEIKYFNDESHVFMAHIGGWENGHWGVIDQQGKWLAEPIFEDLDYQYHDGLFAYYAADKWSDHDVLAGIYDSNQKKVLFDPQFTDIEFLDDGDIKVEVFDEELGRTIQKIIDRNGKERFPSKYSEIYTWEEPYEVTVSKEGSTKHGLIDRNGNEVLPCIYETTWNGISFEEKRIIVEQDKKQGMMDFEGNVLVEPVYTKIYGFHNLLLTVRVGNDRYYNDYREGLITKDGKEALPAVFQRIYWISPDKFIGLGEHCCTMYQIEKTGNGCLFKKQD